MRVFVAGATGAIGRRVVPLLVQGGHEVTGVARSPEKRALLERQGARAAEIDVFDPAAVRNAIHGVEAIVNLTTAVPPGFRVFIPWAWRPMTRVRRRVSANLVDAALAGETARLFVQESFAPIYADAGDAWVDESFSVRPANYNRAALDAEAQADRFTRAGRLGVVLRFGWFYGPGDRVTLLMLDSVRRGWSPFFGRPEGYTTWVSHEDAASAVVATLRVPAGIYNVVENEPLPRREVADGIARLLHVRPPRFLPAWAGRLAGSVGETIGRSLRISNRKLRDASGWVPRYSTTLDGLAAVITASAEVSSPNAP
jgi:nucleoside-diphosphate-sugar epimerase